MDEKRIKESFRKIKEDMNYFFSEIQDIKRTLGRLQNQTQNQKNQTNQLKIPTHQHTPDPVKPLNLTISTGNEGVPTDRQTNQQTDRHIQKFAQFKEKDRISQLQRASEILETLDELKKEVRQKFKQLTSQEMLIFSTIYQLEDQKIDIDYSVISEKLNLSESSVRDYIGKITKKGIPINKQKHGNKKIMLSISEDLKKIATLDTIIQLREL